MTDAIRTPAARTTTTPTFATTKMPAPQAMRAKMARVRGRRSTATTISLAPPTRATARLGVRIRQTTMRATTTLVAPRMCATSQAAARTIRTTTASCAAPRLPAPWGS